MATTNSAKDQLIAAIRGHRHRDYTRTVQIAEWCYSMMTGEDQEEALIQYHTRESKEQKEQRVKITSSKTQFATGKVARYFNEVHRSDTVTDQLFYIDDIDGQKLDRLRDALEVFSHGTTMKEWLDDEYHYRNFYDPNSWLITDWTLAEDGTPQPYPYNVDAKDVLDFQIRFGKTQFVIVRTAKWYKLKADPQTSITNPLDRASKAYTEAEQAAKKKARREEIIPGWQLAYKYTLYGVGHTIEMVQVPDEAAVFDQSEFPDFDLEVVEVNRKDTMFMVRELEQNIDFCPGLRWGYFKDPQTKGRTFVSPLWPSEKLLTDLIRNKSEYDVMKALHGFYMKFVYVQKCKKCGGTGEFHNKAKNTVGMCQPCQGKGKLFQQGSQDVVTITMPDQLTDGNIIDLSKLVHFAEIPSYVASMQKEDVKEAVKDVFSAVFNEALYESVGGTETATAWKINIRSMYNALHPYTDHLARMYKQEIGFIHGILEIQGHLVNNFAITKDYNMETLSELYQQRSTAVSSGSPQVTIDAIDAKILKKQHQNDPEFLDEYEATQVLKPLRDKSPSEVMAIIGRADPNSLLAIQWTYFADIIELMRAENPNVFKLPYQNRKEAFDATSKAFQIMTVDSATPSNIFMS